MDSDSEFIDTAVQYDDQAYEDDDEQEFKHKSLLEKISDLNQPESVKRKRVRSEPRDIHELNLVKQNDSKLNLKQLLDKVTTSSNNEIVQSIKKFSKKVSRKKALNVPLDKVHKDRLERSVLFEETSKEVSKWEPIVLQNRVAEQLTFPLQEPELKLESTELVAKKFKPKTDFEKEIHELLTQSENYLNDEQPLTEAEERALSAMSIEEAKAKHRELRRKRALLSYQEAKLNRQNKIKSRSYRRLKKREKLKKTMKEFEELKKTDPKKALEKLQELEKIRIQERTTLKHLNTGKWAKFNKIRAKNDKETRQKLSEQVDLNKQLVAKLFDDTDESDEDPNLNGSDEEANDREENPLLSLDRSEHHANHETSGDADDAESERLFQSNYNNLIEKMNVEELEEMMKRKKKSKKKEATLTDKVTEIRNDGVDSDSEQSEKNESDDSEVDEENYRKLISEALAEDDAVEDFTREKNETIDKEKGKDVDNFLPGWGSWAGEGIKVSKRRRNRFVKRAPDVLRKDSEHANVIISEKKDELLSRYLPKSLPPGMKDARTYQKKLSKATGSNWNPETVFKNLTEPKVVTKAGKIIMPMDKDSLVDAKKFTDKKDFRKKLSQLVKLD